MKATENISYEDLASNEILKRAILRSLEIIGEATKNISPWFRKKYPYLEMERNGWVKR